MIVAVPAEGTRSWVPKWKTGLSYCKICNVPIIWDCRFKVKEVGFGPMFKFVGL